MKFFLHASNIHQGGGRTLLLALLAVLNDRSCIALLDERLVIPDDLQKNIEVVRVPPSVFGRLRAEGRLRRLVASTDVVLCLGNLPPLFGAAGRVVVFLQNRYLLSSPLSEMPWRPRLRLMIERIWLRLRLIDANVVVQSESMARDTKAVLGVDAFVAPFLPTPAPIPVGRAERPTYDFVYVASGEPHKNHHNLVAAWIELAKNELRPSLALTLDRDFHPQLVNWIESMSRQHGLPIDNLGQLSGEAVAQLYGRCRALVYPSRFESFGVPLVEADRAGLQILAPEADYVRDVVVPVETFDPESPVSICRAVRRYLGQPEAPNPVLSPEEFVTRILALDSRS